MTRKGWGGRERDEPKGTRTCFCDIDRDALPLVGTEEGFDDDSGIGMGKDLLGGVSAREAVKHGGTLAMESSLMKPRASSAIFSR